MSDSSNPNVSRAAAGLDDPPPYGEDWANARREDGSLIIPGDHQDDPVDHPLHYRSHPAGIECIDVVEHFSFNVGNAIKYAWRAGLKPGADAGQDLAKGRWYLDRELKRLKEKDL